jgi:beta-lactam-binding protein with PASTA domain
VIQPTVPDVTKLSLGEAQIKLLESGLTAELSPQANPTSDPKLNGKVSSQNPQAGVRVPKGSGVKLTLVASQVVEPPSATVVVPDIVRMSMAEATAKLATVGLKPGLVPPETSTSDKSLHTKISYQDPRSGSQVPRGSVVKFNIFVYLSEVTVPSVIGLDYQAAGRKLKEAGLKPVSKMNYVDTSDFNKDHIVAAQEPNSGKMVPRDTNVELTVYQFQHPSWVKVPNVVGMLEADAVKTIRDAGFTVRLDTPILSPSSDKSQPGRVISQEPVAGFRQPKEYPVVLKIQR